MVTKVEQLIDLARQQIGIVEKPGKNVKYNTYYYGGTVNNPKLHWCLTFIWWLFGQLNMLELWRIKTASCTTFVNYHKDLKVNVHDAKAGDIVFFDFSGKHQKYEHVGLVESKGDGFLTTIEGNTGISSNGNGGKVMRRNRSFNYVSAVIRMPYEALDKEGEKMAKIYHNILEIPDWAKESVIKGINKGIIKYNDEKASSFNVYEQNCQVIVWLDDLGLL